METMLKVGMKDEIVPLRFRPAGLHGSMHFSRTGCVSFVIVSLDSEIFPRLDPADYQALPTVGNEDAIARVTSEKGWY